MARAADGASAAGHGWKERDLVARPHRIVRPGVVLIDRGPDHAGRAQSLGKARPARRQPLHQRSDGGHLGRRGHVLARGPDLGSQPGEIQDSKGPLTVLAGLATGTAAARVPADSAWARGPVEWRNPTSR